MSTSRRIFSSTTVLLFLLYAVTCNAQKFIRLDKSRNARTTKFYIGEQLHFKIKGEDYWISEEILDVKPADGYILFENRVVSVENITALRMYDSRAFAKTSRASLGIFGLTWGGYSLAGSLFGYELQKKDVIIPAGALVLGQLIHMLFKQKTHKLGKNKKLILVNLDISRFKNAAKHIGP